MNKRLLIGVAVVIGLCLVSRLARLALALLHSGPPVAKVAPPPPGTPKVTVTVDPEPSCDDDLLKAEYKKSGTGMKYEDWCAATIAGPRLVWRNKRVATASPETICGWHSPYHVALKCEGTLPERDPFMMASTTISDVGAESLSWVVTRWRDDERLAREVAAFRALGLEPYAAVLEKARGATNDKKKLAALGDEWDALEQQRVFTDWFEKHCLALVACTPR